MTKRYAESVGFFDDQDEGPDCPDAPEPKTVVNGPMDRLLAAFARGHFDVTAAEIFDEPTSD